MPGEKACVVGAGYVGLVTAACLAGLGHSVDVLEADPLRLDLLRQTRAPFHEADLDLLLERGVAAGRLRFTDHPSTAMGGANFVIIAVQTPNGPDGETDTSFVMEAARAVACYLKPGTLLILKSTCPVGTADELQELLARSGCTGIEVVCNPEFLRQGTAVADFLRPDRIVVGAESCQGAAAAARLYEGIEAPLIVCGRRSAELAKYAANVFLAARVSLINEVSGVCEALGGDIGEVERIVGADPRIGTSYLKAGLGWGGSCLPKDVSGLAFQAARAGCPTPVLDAVLEVNVRRRERAFALLCDAVRGADEPTVGVLGLAFKAGTDDIRGSPALDIIARLLEEEVRVRAHDPLASTPAKLAVPNIAYCRDPYDMATGCDAILLATEWPQYRRLDWRRLRRAMRGAVVVDGRNALDSSAVRAAGLRYLSFGRGDAGQEQQRPRREARGKVRAGPA